jgi:hypothetical protein
MANAQALINEGLWRKDKEFQRLPRLAQCTFLQVLSTKDLDTAGVLTLHLELLAKGCNELTTDQLREDFAVLEASRFLFVDYDTDEILIRSYVRRVSVLSPNAWKSVPKNARLIASEKLCRELAAELRRLRRKDADDLADEIDPVGTPSEPPPDPVGTPSEGDTPSRPLPDPPSPVPVPVPVSPSVGGYLGRPRPECRKHETNSGDKCVDCMKRRVWDEENEAAEKANELERRRRLRDIANNCQVCHGTNWIPDTDPAVKCNHQEVS